MHIPPPQGPEYWKAEVEYRKGLMRQGSFISPFFPMIALIIGVWWVLRLPFRLPVALWRRHKRQREEAASNW